MEKIKRVVSALMPHGPFDGCAVGVIDFRRGQFQSLEALLVDQKVSFDPPSAAYFDLASLTKPLTNSLSFFLNPAVKYPSL